MSEESARILAWRQKQKDAGLRPLTIWVEASMKWHIEELAATRRQTLGEFLSDAVQAWNPDTPVGSTTALRQMMRAEIAVMLGQQQKKATVSTLPTPADDFAPPHDRAAVLARILDLHTRGFSSPYIANQLNIDGIPTFSGKGLWADGTVRRLLAKSRQASQ